MPTALLALLLASPAFAQDLGPCASVEGGAALAGRVEAFGAGLPVAAAHLMLLDAAGEPTCEAISDPEGRFALPLPAGLSRLMVQHPSFSPLAMLEELEPGQELEVVYRLRPPRGGDEELVVYGEREREDVSRQVISAEELRAISGTFGDPVRALQSLPGVARPQSFEGNIVVRGAEGINTAFTVDELPVPFLFHSLVGKSIVNPAFVDDVEFYPGGMPSRFGEVLQAAVNVRTDIEPISGHRGEVDLNLLDLGIAYEWGRGRWTVRGVGRGSWIGNLIGLGAGISTWWPWAPPGFAFDPGGSEGAQLGLRVAFAYDRDYEREGFELLARVEEVVS